MALEWLGPTATAVVAIAGIAGTAYAANQSRRTQLELSKAQAVRELITEKRRLYSEYLETLEDKRIFLEKVDHRGKAQRQARQELADIRKKIDNAKLMLAAGKSANVADIDELQNRLKLLEDDSKELDIALRNSRDELDSIFKRINHQAAQILVLGGLGLGSLAVRASHKLSEGDNEEYDEARIQLWRAMHEDVSVDRHAPSL